MNTRGKMLKSVLLVLLGLVVIAATKQVFAQVDTWQLLAPMPTPRFSGALGAIGGKLYAFSAHPGVNSNVPSLEVFDPAANTWTTRTPSPFSRSVLGSAVVGNSLYVLGGCFNSDCRIGLTNLVEVYDSTTDTWTTLAPMPTSRSSPAVGVIDGKIYVAGGATVCPPCEPQPAALEVFDPATNTWSTKAPIPTPRELAAGAGVNGKLYVIGGFVRPANVNTNLVEIYDPATDTWTSGAPMPTARGQIASAVIDGLIHVVGGHNGTDTIATHEVYDPATNTWSTKAPMTVPRRALMAAAIGSKLYAAGGFAPPAFDIAGATTLEVYTAAPSVSNQPPVAICRNVTVNTAPGTCSASTVSVNNGSFDPDGFISTLAQSPAGPYGKGTTNVTLTVTDNNGASSSCSGTVTVVDNQPPAITCPVAQVIDATGPSGAVATFSPTVSDNCPGAIGVSCTPASGSTFPIGSTSVSCSATDGSGNSSSCGFTVTVKGAAGQISALVTLVNSFNLPAGIQNSFVAKLQNALASINAGNVTAACNQLNAFINETQAQSGKALTVDQANQLITSANRIKAVIGCP